MQRITTQGVLLGIDYPEILVLMKNSILALILVSTITQTQASTKLPHLDLEMDGFEYQSILKNTPSLIKENSADELQTILVYGKRNLDWNTKINQARPNNPLELSTADSQVGIPIDNPRMSNRAIMHDTFENLKKTLPPEFIGVVLGKDEIPSTPLISDEAYLQAARLFDRLYQAASRWLLQEPYMSTYASRSKLDIRGYYFLSNDSEREENLKNYVNLPKDKQAAYSTWLVSVCHNSGKEKASCTSELNSTINAKKEALGFYNKYEPASKRVYDGFFEVQNPRRDSKWLSDSTIGLAFQEPKSAEVRNWLVDNIQDEWRFDSFKLLLDFNMSSMSAPKVVFEAGATPHVNGLGGGTITMDSNRSLQEYNVRWTIRHEYGHVLGFPDCYIEFFDTQKSVMINYQIDTTNLMCSRRGHLQAKHVDQMRKHYK